MENLTDNQKRIISELETEFAKINETTSIGKFSLIDVNAIMSESVRRENIKKENALKNKAIAAENEKRMSDYCIALNKDFSQGNLPVIAKIFNSDISIESKAGHEINSYNGRGVANHLKIHIYSYPIQKTEYITNTGGDAITKILGYKYSFEYNNGNYYNSMELFLKSATFTEKLIDLITATNKYFEKDNSKI